MKYSVGVLLFLCTILGAFADTIDISDITPVSHDAICAPKTNYQNVYTLDNTCWFTYNSAKLSLTLPATKTDDVPESRGLCTSSPAANDDAHEGTFQIHFDPRFDFRISEVLEVSFGDATSRITVAYGQTGTFYIYDQNMNLVKLLDDTTTTSDSVISFTPMNGGVQVSVVGNVVQVDYNVPTNPKLCALLYYWPSTTVTDDMPCAKLAVANQYSIDASVADFYQLIGNDCQIPVDFTFLVVLIWIMLMAPCCIVIAIIICCCRRRRQTVIVQQAPVGYQPVAGYQQPGYAPPQGYQQPGYPQGQYTPPQAPPA
eukprot:TRINITY_DN1902_c0_g1_i1.p1 TRINITY_DN1902_c0_g1~~TRINITY_DN1902_c0_g1_i1.p1  ORF type:complete len:314 (+),score=56.55 TRINITY_DN1902_c0_g1_i1:20-961(+)